MLKLPYFVCSRGGGVAVPWYTPGGQRTTSGSQFSLSAMWVLKIELRSSGLGQVPLPTEPI